MKKTLITISLLASCSLANAQREGLWIAPQFTIGGGTMTGVTSGYSVDASAIFSIGADAYYMFNNHMGIGSGLGYGGYAFQWTAHEVAAQDLKITGTQVTLDVPIYLRLVTGNGGGFFAHIGIVNSIMLAAEEDVTQNGYETKTTGSSAKGDFKNYSLSPFVYFGGNIRCGNKVQMTLGPTIQYQVNNNFSDAAGVNGRYLTFGVKLGVGIHATSSR